jgi:hypothetical protein
MIRRPVAWLALLLLAGALLAGCGSGSSTTTATTTTSQSTSTPAATAPAGGSTAPTTPSGTSAIASPQAVDACKQAIRSQKTLPPNAKSKLEAVCVKAANGDTAAVRKAAREVCEEVINRSPVPAGASKDQALAACRK